MLPVAMGAVPEMADTEVEEFLKLYREDGGSCVLHTYFKESVASCWPDLSQLFEEQFVNKTLEELLAVGEGLCLDITDETLINIEEATRNQAKCNLWFALRAGRVTASNFRAVCATRVQKPSLSLLKRICYPQMYKAVFRAGMYGCQHEATALKRFYEIHRPIHTCKVSSCGLFINRKFPWCAATPDALLHCQTCGICCVEIKCPYCARDSSVFEITKEGKRCLLKTPTGMMLNRKHAYFYQVQMQMAVTNCTSCFFVVWSKKDIYIEKVGFMDEFWTEEKK